MKYRKTIAILLLLSFAYGGWYVWQARPTPPLQARLFPLELEDVERVVIQESQQPPFELSQEGGNWAVQRQNRYLTAQKTQVEGMLNRLLRAKSNGLANVGKTDLRVLLKMTLITSNSSQFVEFLAPPDSVKNVSYLRLNQVPDVYRVKGFSVTDLPTKFTDYQNQFLLDISSFHRIDSLGWLGDSTYTTLLLRPENERSLDSLYSSWQRLRGGQFAEEFDEIGMRNLQVGSYLIFGKTATDPVRLTVYHDSLSVPAYVLQSSQFPEDFWLSDSLPYSHELIIRKKVLK